MKGKIHINKFMAKMRKDLKKPPKLTRYACFSFYLNNVYKLSKTWEHRQYSQFVFMS